MCEKKKNICEVRGKVEYCLEGNNLSCNINVQIYAFKLRFVQHLSVYIIKNGGCNCRQKFPSCRGQTIGFSPRKRPRPALALKRKVGIY